MPKKPAPKVERICVQCGDVKLISASDMRQRTGAEVLCKPCSIKKAKHWNLRRRWE